MLAIVQQYKKLFTLLMVSEFASAGPDEGAPKKAKHLDGASKALADAIENREVNDKTKLDPELQRRLIKFIGYHTSDKSNALGGKFIKPETIAKFRESGDENTARILQKLYNISQTTWGTFEKGIVSFLEDWMKVKAEAIAHRKDLRKDIADTQAPGSLEAQIGKTKVSIDTMIAFLKDSAVVTQAIEEGKDFDRQGYSLWNIFSRILGNSEDSIAKRKILEGLFAEGGEVRERALSFKRSIWEASYEPNESKKFDRGYMALIGHHNFQQNENMWGGFETSGARMLKHARKVLPWVFGLYVADIPLPFIKSAFPNVDLDKAFAFTTWVKNGMQGEFNPEKKVNTGADALDNLKGLRSILATSTSYIKANANKGNLSQVTAKVRELISTYIIYRFGPDADVLRSSTNNLFENIGDFLGLSGKPARLIEQIVKEAHAGRVDFNKVFQLEYHLSENDRQWGLFGIWAWDNSMYLGAFRNRNAYMASVQRQGDVLEQYVRAIYEGPKAFKEMQRNDLRPGDPIPNAEKGAKKNPNIARKGRYGTALNPSWSGEQVLQSLRGTRPSAKNNWDSLGWITNNMRSLEKDVDAKRIGYNDLAAGIAKGRMVSMSEFDANMQVTNTWINKKKIPTNVLQLMKQRGDTHMFVAPIEYTVGGQTLKYTLYLRPDCSNFMMVPDQFDNRTFGATSARLPIIIPWTFFIPPTSSASGTGSLPIDGDPVTLPDVTGPAI